MNAESTQALVELLFLAVYLDDRLSTLENDRLEQALATLGWRAEATSGIDVGAAYRAAHDAATCAIKTENFLRERTALIKAGGHSSLAFEWLGKILGSDGLDDGEKRFLKQIQGQLFD